ncbi:biotin/lipoyl-binding carrier protein [Luteipulveratus halotolerans]|uniref:Acetyl-CoA carboxylase n=1 Tax=Luteipulveratus halotolerans TaxID=1631356 RepID=A0A0L6CM77_9MICO|nr:biotin/lipoyl-binding carrier protein [Luteipulveratus halotolerans]KNX38740.1 acetyl-CoA carboxylase [Luteipulveratus halotolerans]
MPVTKTQEIASDLVANVAQVHVTVGQQVEAGEELVLLESMKMEIPVVPEFAGTVSQVRVQPGDVVQEGDVLVVLT